MKAKITIEKDTKKKVYNIFYSTGKKSILIGRYNRNKLLDKMEDEDIKGAGYVGKFYEKDIKERIFDDINEKFEEAKKETGIKDPEALIPIIKKRMGEIAL